MPYRSTGIIIRGARYDCRQKLTSGLWITGVMDLREDDIQEFPSYYLRLTKAEEL